jgi:hypothetical protein
MVNTCCQCQGCNRYIVIERQSSSIVEVAAIHPLLLTNAPAGMVFVLQSANWINEEIGCRVYFLALCLKGQTAG